MLAFVLLAAASTIVSSPSSSSTHGAWPGQKEYVYKPEDDTVPTLIKRGSFFGQSVERTGTQIPTLAKCMPEKRVVKLRKSHDLSLQYYPSCTRVERCGGCCALDEFFSCQPTEIEYINYRVTVSKYTGTTQLETRGKEIVRVERHLKCKCDCIIKATHCNALQEYVKHECKCMCTNHDEKQKCLEDDPKLKFWDPSDCSCQCINVKDCTTGYVFNKHSCSCEPEQRQRIPNTDQRGTQRRRQP